VARAAGVAPSTVSRALHGNPRISTSVTADIRRLAREMGYTPSLPARSLVTRNTATIGMVISHAADPFRGQVVLGAEEEAHRHGYSVYLSSLSHRADCGAVVIRSFHERRVTGLVVSGAQYEALIAEFGGDFPLPTVIINYPLYPYSVSTDNLSGARQAVKHLLQLGHRRIAYVANEYSHMSNRTRLAGYRAVLAEEGIPRDEALVVQGDGELSGGAAAVGRLFALGEPPTAVFCFNDMTAIGVIHALNRAGRPVPECCSVVGFDDLELAAYYSPPLTTVRQARYELGQRAMGMLLALIKGRVDLQPEMLPAELVVRETTAPPPAPAGARERR